MAYVGQKPADKALTSDDIEDGSILNADINSSAAIATSKLASNAITINGSSVPLGGSVTTATIPTVTGVTPATITNDATTITITGTNFSSTIPQVEALNPSTGIYYIRYQIATYITTGASRYISARLYFNGSTICMPWSSSSHISGNQTTQSSGSQAILDVTDTSNTFKIQMQSQNPVVVVGNNEAGYSGTATMSDVVVIRLGDT